MTVGILAVGAYLPQSRLSRQVMAQANTWFSPGLRGLGRGERAMANWDEDAVTMAVEAARDCLTGVDRAAVGTAYLASTSYPFLDRQNSGIVADEFTQQEEQKEESRQVVRAELAVEQIARRDRGMRDLVAARGQLQTELDILRAQHLGDKHREVARLLITIPMLDKLIEEAAKRFNESWMAFGPDRAQIGRAADHANTFRQLAQEVRQLEAARNRAKRETVAVGGKNLAIKRLQEDVRRIEKQLAKTNARIKELTVESGGATSRINVVNLGDLPHFPINTGRRTRSTVLASAGGAASGVAVVLLFALLRRLLPHDDEAEERLLSATADPSICIVHLGRTQRIGRELGELLNPVDPTTLHIYRLPANTEVELHHHDMDEYWLFISGHPQVTRRSPSP